MEDEPLALADNDTVSVHAGFPNPAVDQLARGGRLALDLNRLLIKRPSSTYLFRITGHDWEAAGIFDGDVAVIDRAANILPTDYLLIWQASGFSVCRAKRLKPTDTLWGVITAIIHPFRD